MGDGEGEGEGEGEDEGKGEGEGGGEGGEGESEVVPSVTPLSYPAVFSQLFVFPRVEQPARLLY
jgi:hypothetical protein